jgi:phosphoglucosamine mutase
MLSASHNPVGDNGIKFFGPDGFKLDDDEEAHIEALVAEGGGRRPEGVRIGRRLTDRAAIARYVEHLTSVSDTDLGGLKVVVDGANGAASSVAPQVYRQLGAEVIAVHCSPDGANINDACGSTHPDVITAATVANGADAGVSHDGDADRLIAATHLGAEVDGDVILAILARRMHERGTLAQSTVVTTVMTNLGFRHAMGEAGIEVLETAVGDRHVLAAMRARDLNLGGEQSGHVIDLDHATTGDGILTAVRLLAIVRSSGTPLAELARVMTRLPQVLVNVDGVDRDRLADAALVWEAVRAVEAELGGDGRVLLRASGTERVIRVMVEAASLETAERDAARISDVVRAELGSV